MVSQPLLYLYLFLIKLLVRCIYLRYRVIDEYMEWQTIWASVEPQEGDCRRQAMSAHIGMQFSLVNKLVIRSIPCLHACRWNVAGRLWYALQIQ